jgi:hypothetical protein
MALAQDTHRPSPVEAAGSRRAGCARPGAAVTAAGARPGPVGKRAGSALGTGGDVDTVVLHGVGPGRGVQHRLVT